jgi:hypothetical protein
MGKQGRHNVKKPKQSKGKKPEVKNLEEKKSTK